MSVFLTDDLWLMVLPHLGYESLCAAEGVTRQLRRLAGADGAWKLMCERHGFRADLHHGPRFADWTGWKVGPGTGRYYSPRHGTPLNSRNKRLKCVWRARALTWRGPCTSARP
jgi:hypothetical protein